RLIESFLVLVLLLVLTGCASFFPSSDSKVQSPWKSYEEVLASFDRVTPNVTTSRDLKGLGFDPYATPNIKVLTYLNVMERFMLNPSIRREDLDIGIQNCLEARENCYAYELDVGNTASKRFGNLFLDLFGFYRKSKEIGWSFNGLIVIKDELVVYKLHAGKPNIERYESKKKPLGPLQEIEGTVVPVVTRGL
ncbi:MAG TPA: hypothetical protein VFR01_00690, partial [Geobacterales bacterium]|nr:hypothetical protein [Geobacterales bacterium]